jgi:hypothetical protein
MLTCADTYIADSRLAPLLVLVLETRKQHTYREARGALE